MSTQRDPLEPLIESWRAETPKVGESLNLEVWRRIANADSRPTRTNWLAMFELAFARPAFAAAFVAACMLLGLFLAEVRLSQLHEQRSAMIQASYLRLLTPSSEFSYIPAQMEVAR